jgi:hypothetical protein
MWAKNGRGLKKIGISLLFLVLVVGNLGAWSWDFGKKKDQPLPPPQPVVQADSREVTLSPTELEKTLQARLDSLQPVLAGYVQLEQDWKAQLEENGLWLGDLETSIASLIASSTRVETLVPIAQVSQTVLKADYDLLLSQKTQKDLEAQGCWGDLIVANTKIEALEGNKWGGVIGAGVSYNPTVNSLAMTLDVGVRYKSWALTVGAYAIPNFAELEDLLELERYIPAEYRLGISKSF